MYRRDNQSLEALNNALVGAAYEGNELEVKNLLGQGAQVNSNQHFSFKSGSFSISAYRTPLQAAASNGHTKVMEVLMKAGAELDYINELAKYNSDKTTALHLAAQVGQIEAVKLLLKHGATIDIVGGNKETPLYTALKPEIDYAIQDKWVSLPTSKKEAIRNTIKVLVEKGASLDGYEGYKPSNFEMLYTILNEMKTDGLALRIKTLEDENSSLKIKIRSLETQSSLDKSDIIGKLNFQINKMQQAFDTFKAENEELKNQIQNFQQKLEQLKTQHENMAIETNHTQKDILEIQDKLNNFQITDAKNKYQGKEKEIIKVQAMVRGFFARKKHSILKLKEARVNEVKGELTEAISKFIKEGNYDASFELSKAAKLNDWHKAAQIIRGIPEQEFKSKNGKILKY